MDKANVHNVDSIMEIMTEVNIGTDGMTMNYPTVGQGAPENYNQYSAVPNYFVDTSMLMDRDEGPSNSSEAKAEDPNALKSWREGMEMKTADDGTAKTMFISQNLNKQYEEKEQRVSLISYTACVSKVVREADYFNAILKRVGDDLKLTEFRTPREDVFGKREIMKKKLSGVKDMIDDFIANKLTGEPTKGDAAPIKPAVGATAEYAFLSDKKPGPGEANVSLNICVDCNVEIPIQEGQDLENAMVLHSQTELHRNSMPEPPPPRKSKTELTASLSPVGETTENKKALDNLKKSPILRLNRITSCLIDDNVVCEVCDLVFQSNVQDIFKHMGEGIHKDKLNMFNLEAQKSIVEKYPEVFGENGAFQLTDVHTNLHKIFVDPSIKQAYCGLCCRQLPFSQSNIDEHIFSAKHDKLLIEAVEGSFAEFVGLGIDQDILNGIKAKSTSMTVEAPMPKEIKVRKDPPMQQQPQQNSQHQPQPQQPFKDENYILDAADIQNFRKMLPDKSIKSIPDFLDGNNMPIHTFDNYDQPELKKFLNDNGLQRQAGGKYKCTYCPNLEIPNSRYAFRHVSKHKTSSSTSQNFENWKRQPNRQQGYSNDPKAGRVVMHKNGVNYWCTSCRLPLIDASTAFAHVKTDNHVMYVDGVSFSSGTIFDCTTCKTTINGEKNACQHLSAAKHRENSKLDTAVKQEGRMNMMEERKQKQYEKQKLNDAHRKERLYGEQNQNAHCDEEKLLENNGIVYSPESGIYRCGYCGWNNRKRAEMLTHIFSYEHTACISKQGR